MKNLEDPIPLRLRFRCTPQIFGHFESFGSQLICFELEPHLVRIFPCEWSEVESSAFVARTAVRTLQFKASFPRWFCMKSNPGVNAGYRGSSALSQAQNMSFSNDAMLNTTSARLQLIPARLAGLLPCDKRHVVVQVRQRRALFCFRRKAITDSAVSNPSSVL